MPLENCVEVAKANSPEWHAARPSGIGASEAAEAVGLSEWGTPLSLYRKKLGIDPPEEENDAMIEGRVMENAIVRLFRIKSGIKVQTRKPPIYRSTKYPWMIATPDALTTVPHGVEVKKTGFYMADQWGKDGSDEIPNQYLIQTQHQMAVLDLEIVWVPVLVAGRYRCFKVNRNDRLIGDLIEAERAFWDRIERQIPPEPSWTHRSTPELVKSMFGVDGSVVDLSPESKLIWDRYEKLGQTAKETEAERAELKARVLFEMGEAQFGLLGDGRMVRRSKQTIQEHVVATFEKTDVRAVKVPQPKKITVQSGP